MLGEVFSVAGKDVFLDHTNGPKPLPVDITGNSLRHSSHVVILAQKVDVFLAKRVYRSPVTGQQELGKFLVAGGIQEFVQGHREHTDQLHHSDRERLVFVDGDAQK